MRSSRRAIRRISAHIEGLAPAAFILLVGVVGGVLQGIPRFFLGTVGGSGQRIAQFAAVVFSAVLWWTAALLLWWIAVRRRRYSLWKTAGHVTLGLALADVLNMALAAVVASIDTKGAYAEAVLRAPLTFASSNLVLVLIRSLGWFVGSAMVVAVGRYLNVGGHRRTPSLSNSTLP